MSAAFESETDNALPKLPCGIAFKRNRYQEDLTIRISASWALAAPALASLAAARLSVAVQTPSPPQAAQVVAQTPPMGWNSWNYFAEKVDDKGVASAAEEIVATGMKDPDYV